jgi:hypothetical protein
MIKKLTCGLLAASLCVIAAPTVSAAGNNFIGSRDNAGVSQSPRGGGVRGGGGYRGYAPTGGYPAYPGWGWGAGFYLYDPFPFYPQPVVRQEIIVQTPVEPLAPQPVQYWYFCTTANAYYPYVSTCAEGWKAVPAVPGEQ